MTINQITPGCFGSAIQYRLTAPECVGCALERMCASTVSERQGRVLTTVAKLDKVFDQNRLGSVSRWFAGRWKRDEVSDRKRSASVATLDRLKTDDVNVYELRHRMNPAPKNSLLHGLFEGVITLRAFTRRDLFEDILEREQHNLTKAEAKRQVDILCDALIEAGVLKTENRGILCLTN